jgi:hypothetical protein
MKCKHARFIPIKTGADGFGEGYKCKQCGLKLDHNDAVDLLNGEFKAVRGVYDQEVHLVRLTNRSQL